MRLYHPKKVQLGTVITPLSNQTPSACACEVGNCEMLASPLAYLSRGI